MKLATFTHGQRTRVGLVVGDEVVDLSETGLPEGMRELTELGPEGLEQAATALERGNRLALDEVRLEAPVRPGKFFAVGLNSRDHRGELTPAKLVRNLQWVRLGVGSKLAHPRSRYPLFFTKATSCVTGPYDPIYSPRDEPSADYEGEVCVVVGRRCRHASADEAHEAILGYTITNDVSVREWQLDSPMGPILAKGYDTHGPIGPWIVTRDERPAFDFELRTFVNGEQRQQGNTGDLIKGPEEIVSILSRFCTLEPGDLIALGTFAGVGLFDKRFLKPGDTVRIEVDGIGAIENPVVEEPG